MGEAKDTAGIALFFMAGTAVGEWLVSGPVPPEHRHILASASMMLFASAAIAAGLTKAAGPRRTVSVLSLFALAGLLCRVSVSIHGGISVFQGSLPAEALASMSGKFKDLIDSVPYRDSDSAAIIKALISGDRSDVAPHIRDAFRDSGASHILALSGMHLGIIYAILLKMFSVFGNTPAARKARSLSIIAISAWYTAVTGAASSLVRALLFITLSETARLAGRETRPMNIFFVALTIQLAVSPGNITSAGFQLSYLAMAGIYILYPKMKSWFPGPDSGTMWIPEANQGQTAGSNRQTPALNRRRGPMKRLWDAAALTIACQAFTAPAAWLHFGTFPEYFIITNLLAVPLSNFIMITSVGVIALSALGICPSFLIDLDCFCIGLLKDILVTISELP